MQDSIGQLRSSVRQLWVWNAILTGLVLVLGAVSITGLVSEKKSLRTQAVHLISPEGRVLAELAARDGFPGLYLKDEAGLDRAALFHDDDGTGLYVMDSDGVTRIGIAQFAHGGGGVALHGKDSKGAVVLYFKTEGSLRIFDMEGKVTNQVSAQGAQTEN
jgi:hypothetical protein